MHHRAFAAAIGAAALTLSLAACGDDSASGTGGNAVVSSDSSVATAQADFFTVTDPWVKAADEGMTAVFGTLVNDSPQEFTVVSATSEITSEMELHETVQNDDGSMGMQSKEGGFTVPAGGTHELAPGGDHLMVMDLNRALKPGETVRIALTFADDSTKELDAIVKTFTGAEEEYQHGETDMSESDGSE